AADARPPRADRGEGFKGKPRPKGGKPEGKPERGDRGDRGNRPDRGDRGGKDHGKSAPQTYEARPPRAEKPIDPDNPFAVLLALKGRT
ncbi:conserved hypothetical protein, partial [Rhodobacter ferrooxidans]